MSSGAASASVALGQALHLPSSGAGLQLRATAYRVRRAWRHHRRDEH